MDNKVIIRNVAFRRKKKQHGKKNPVTLLIPVMNTNSKAIKTVGIVKTIHMDVIPRFHATSLPSHQNTLGAYKDC